MAKYHFKRLKEYTCMDKKTRYSGLLRPLPTNLKTCIAGKCHENLKKKKNATDVSAFLCEFSGLTLFEAVKVLLK